MTAGERTLDIFRIRQDGSPIWIEAVENAAQARARIAELMQTKPGEYKVHDSRTNQFIDVFAKPA